MFRVVLHAGAARELREVPAYHRKTIVETMESILQTEPTTERRSRVKRMHAGFHPPFRLRVGDYRVYYDVDESQRTVMVLHIWRKGRQTTPDEFGQHGPRRRRT